METTRRTFLKAGLVAAAVLAVGGGIYRYTHPAPQARFILDGPARAALDAMVPAILDGALPAAGAARTAAIRSTTDRVHQAILGLPLSAQGEIQDLFGLLALGPVRRFLAGVPEEWQQASVAQVAAFLQGWRTHRLALLQSGYAALHDLVIGSWYADAANWTAIGYPGPLKELSA
jgi:hypothetical protein